MTTSRTTAIIRIVTPYGITAGAGFVLSDLLAVTYAHIIEAAAAEQPARSNHFQREFNPSFCHLERLQ